MAKINLDKVGRAPSADTRVRRAIQKLGLFQFTAGTGLNLDSSGKFSVDVDSDGGLEVNSGGVAVKIADASLAAEAGGLSVALESGGGINLGASGLKIANPSPITLETPTGSINGTNADFTLAAQPADGVTLIFTDGLLMAKGASADYTLAGNTVSFNTGAIPVTGDVLTAVYMSASSAVGETPAGTINGANTAFTLTSDPVDSSLMLFLNGVLMLQGATADYTLSSTTVTFNAGSAPQTGDTLYAAYQKETV